MKRMKWVALLLAMLITMSVPVTGMAEGIAKVSSPEEIGEVELPVGGSPLDGQEEEEVDDPLEGTGLEAETDDGRIELTAYLGKKPEEVKSALMLREESDDDGMRYWCDSDIECRKQKGSVTVYDYGERGSYEIPLSTSGINSIFFVNDYCQRYKIAGLFPEITGIDVYDYLKGKGWKFEAEYSRADSEVDITYYRKGSILLECWKYWDSGTVGMIGIYALNVPTQTTVTLAAKEITLGVGEKFDLKPKVEPASMAGKLKFKSGNTSIAKVNSKGIITAGKKSGTVKIKAIIDGKTLATCKVTVKKAPDKVMLNRTELTIKEGKAFQLRAKLPEGTYTSSLTWKSSKPKVAKVDGNGKIEAVRSGTTTITVKTANNKTEKCKVTVVSDKPVYRALLIGQMNYGSGSGLVPLYGVKKDISLMKKMLNSIKGPAGGKYDVKDYCDKDANSVYRLIRNTFRDADDDDVSLFYIACHGDSESYDAPFAGCLNMYDGSAIFLDTLAEKLNMIPGRIIVILQSCGSGAAVYQGTNDEITDSRNRAEAFNTAAVRAFSRIDKGIRIDTDGNAVGESYALSNTGDLRIENKFYVLTATAYRQRALDNRDKGSQFTVWLTAGIGTSGHMPADNTPKDGTTTLNELYKYIKLMEKKEPLTFRGQEFIQEAQVYPENSAYALFCR